MEFSDHFQSCTKDLYNMRRASVCPSIRPSVHLSVRPSVHPSVRASIRPSDRPSVPPSPSLRASLHLPSFPPRPPDLPHLLNINFDWCRVPFFVDGWPAKIGAASQHCSPKTGSVFRTSKKGPNEQLVNKMLPKKRPPKLGSLFHPNPPKHSPPGIFSVSNVRGGLPVGRRRR